MISEYDFAELRKSYLEKSGFIPNNLGMSSLCSFFANHIQIII